MALSVTVQGQSFVAEDTTFSSGRNGYRTQGKLLHNGKKYQVQVIVSEVWAKDDPRRGAAAKPAKVAKAANAPQGF